MAIPKRGLQDIRTYSGRVGQTFLPHKAHMKLACLEMEKVRREKEKESAMHRVKDINARTREIEQEKSALLQRIGLPEGTQAPAGAEKKVRPAQSPLRRQGPRGLRLRY